MKNLLRIFVFTVVAGGVIFATTAGTNLFYEQKPAFNTKPVVYEVYGEGCKEAVDMQGKPTSCEEAKKDGNYDTTFIAPDSLRTAE